MFEKILFIIKLLVIKYKKLKKKLYIKYSYILYYIKNFLYKLIKY